MDTIIARNAPLKSISTTPEVTQLVYGRDIRDLSDAVSEYAVSARKEAIWVLVDNLDKSWPVQSARAEDALLIRCLLEASRKLQRQFENRGTECHVVVFVRNDIYEHLVQQTPDRGKDTAVLLDWSDPEVFKEIIRRRIMRSTDLQGEFENLWRIVFDSHVRGEESFSYVLARTLMRPREVLRFCRACLDVAVSRGRDKVTESDILQAEKACSEDSLLDVAFELKDVAAELEDVPYAFHRIALPFDGDALHQRMAQAGIGLEEVDRAKDLLVWFGFLGYHLGSDEERYSYQYQHDLRKMSAGLPPHPGYTIHRAFRAALECVVSE